MEFVNDVHCTSYFNWFMAEMNKMDERNWNEIQWNESQPIRYRLKFHIHPILKPFCPLSQSMLNAERRTESNQKKKTFLLNAFRISLIIPKWQMEFVTCQKMTTKENCSAFYFVRTINDKWEFGLNWKRIWNYVRQKWILFLVAKRQRK